ncbi:fungal-specific transcription factor domain-containing protein [Dactylonectria macrodidyma]|uniref:Fungal-specific transcription factor domain-containing protein n=1 Tax=Dactylonectria macrodidyma TaxID=307937 RepID=A0A9P9IF24_9HYPO|nr:fungal-specific transcription factor domain-containing protein [Dactylonectria macrodidyma]
MTTKNVRLDSLPPNRDVASRDCRLCTKRRIRCDRTLPECRKCTSRKLSCPGFDPVPLRWDQGVASRGKLSGRAIPVVPPARRMDEAGPLSKSDMDEPDASAETERREHGVRAVENCAKSPPDFSTLIPCLTEELGLVGHYLSTASVDNLLSYFCNQVTPMLLWLDGPHNTWRNSIPGLARDSECLRLSIMGLAAAHLSVTCAGSNNKAVLLHYNRNLRDASLRDLNHKMSLELTRGDPMDEQNNGDSNVAEILATMLMLCFAEMLTPESTDWKLHLRACRAFMERHSIKTWREEPQGSVVRFLFKEALDLETYANISTFTRTPNLALKPSRNSTFDRHFWIFTDLLHEITMEERRLYNLEQEGRQLPDMDIGIWKAKLELAHSMASACIGSVLDPDYRNRRSFNEVIRAHYYAGLVYCHQALVRSADSAESMAAMVDQLFHEILAATSAVPTCTIFCHDLFFPLFLAGTECRANPHRQRIVQGLFETTVSKTGLWCNNGGLAFLRKFWASEDFSGNWIHFAREKESHISPFLIF